MTPVVATFVARPGCEVELESMFREVIPATHAESGCLHYQLNRDVDDARRFVWTEFWESRGELERHLKERHIVDLFARVADLIERSEVITLEKVDGGDVA